MIKIHNETSIFDSSAVSLIEKKYKSKFVFESCIKNAYDGWCNFPAAIFYTEEKHPKGSNYIAFYRKNDPFDVTSYKLMVTDGISATKEPFKAIQIGNDVIYSRYRHDYREFGAYFVDGGRDYLRYGGSQLGKNIKPVKIRVVKDSLEIIDNE